MLLSNLTETYSMIRGLTKQMRKGFIFILWVVASLAIAQVVSDVNSGPHARAQAAADALKESTQADIAFLAAGLLKQPDPGGDLAGLLQYPSDEVVVMRLLGKQIFDAAEKSVSNYPDSSSAFLQLSGMVVTFNPSAPSGSRVKEISVNEMPLDKGNSYQVAMPASLARGALGYFKIWEKSQIVSTSGKSVEDVLKGKTGSVRSPRYIVAR